MSLRTRLLGLFILAAVVPLLALGGIEYARSLRALEAMIAAQNERVAERAAEQLRARAALLQSDLHLLAENAETQRWLSHVAQGTSDAGAAGEADRFVRDAWTRLSATYASLSFLDSNQRELLRVGGGGDIGGVLQPVSLGIVNAETHESLGMVTAVPAIAGVFPVDVLASGFGETGHGMVLDRSAGRIVYHPDRSMLGTELDSVVGPGQVPLETLEQPRGTFRYRLNDTLRVASFVSLALPPWTVIVSGDMDEFAGPFTAVRRWTLLLFLAVAIAATIVFSGLLRRTTRSLEELTAATAVVGRGNLTPSLPPPGRDEIGRLTASFHTMVREIRAMVSQIESSRQMAVLGQFAAQLSHEIRNPLTSIKLNLQKLEREAREKPMSETSTRALDIALREVGRLDGVVRAVLRLTRDRSPTTEIASLHRVTDEAIDAIAAQAEAQHVVIERVFRAEADTVRIDSAQVKGAVVNLAVNALEAMPNGGTLRVSSSHAGGRITLRVSDTGPGIAEAARDDVFRPFFTTKEMGTGLGLPLAKRAAQDNGGTLTLVSSSGSGAEFALELPCVEEE